MIVSGCFKKRVCLFALYDPRTATGTPFRLLGHVKSYLSALRDSGFVVHVALSGMTRLDPRDEAMFLEMGVVAHPRCNAGHDFGAWQDLIRQGCIEGADSILLANDSVFGPLAPLPPIIKAMQLRDRDVWGMVESREGRWHLQSWFLCFSATAFASPAVRRVMNQPFHEMKRDEIVLHGELGLGAAILADGLRWDARWRTPERRLRRLVPGNPMHLDFLSVVRCGAVPFLKADLVRDNPARIGWMDQWRRLLAESGSFPASLVEEALAARPGLSQQRQTRIMRALYAAISCDRPEAMRALFR